MRTRRELASFVIDQAFQMLADNTRGLQIHKALVIPPGGYRSSLGTLKHIAGWSHVYRSYALEAEPRHWEHIDWPRGLQDTVEPSQSYLDEVIAWAQAAHTSWLRCLDELPDDAALDSPRATHWGEVLEWLRLGHYSTARRQNRRNG